MTDNTPMVPTDAELMDLGHECELDAIEFGRAVLTRWGQPAHSGEPVAWLDPWTGTKVTTDYDAYGKHGIPLYTAPQPVEREPLTDEQSYALLHRMADESDKWAEGLSYEPTREQVSGWCVAFLMRELPAHDIKGGQHGTE